MQQQSELEQTLMQKLSVNQSDIEAPAPGRFKATRKLVELRGLKKTETDDIFTLLAGFLNMKIKLYHAVIASVVIALCILLATREKRVNGDQLRDAHFISNIAAVNNSTVLSSINTCKP